MCQSQWIRAAQPPLDLESPRCHVMDANITACPFKAKTTSVLGRLWKRSQGYWLLSHQRRPLIPC